MKEQHTLIKGYRDLTQTEIDYMNCTKELGNKLGELIDTLQNQPDIDKRWLAMGKSSLQVGIMEIVRSIARPNSF